MKSGLPKKYAKMGFAKGWKAFKRLKKAKPAPTRKRAKSKPQATSRAIVVAKPKVIVKWKTKLKESGRKMRGSISKFKNKFKSAVTSKTAIEMGVTVGEVAAGGILGSLAFGAIPVPKTFTRPDLVKSSAQFVVSGLLALIIKEKHTRTVLAGSSALGLVGTVKAFFPKVPALAGEADFQFYGDPLDGDPLDGMDGEDGQSVFSGDPLAGNVSPFTASPYAQN